MANQVIKIANMNIRMQNLTMYKLSKFRGSVELNTGGYHLISRIRYETSLEVRVIEFNGRWLFQMDFS